MALRQAVLWGLIDTNPCAGVILPKVERSESRAMTPDEVKRFLAACRTNDRFIIFELALETGLRPQECTALRWQDVDLTNRRIRVQQAATADFDRTNARVAETKTKHSVRTVGISRHLAERLKVQRAIVDAMIAEAQADAGTKIAKPRNSKGPKHQRRQVKKNHATTKLLRLRHFDLVFPSANGGIKALDNLNKRDFREAATLAGLKPGRYSFKSLRHTCATLLAETLHPKKLQRHLGHSSATTTLNYYVHVDDGSQFDGSEAMEGLYANMKKAD